MRTALEAINGVAKSLNDQERLMDERILEPPINALVSPNSFSSIQDLEDLFHHALLSKRKDYMLDLNCITWSTDLIALVVMAGKMKLFMAPKDKNSRRWFSRCSLRHAWARNSMVVGWVASCNPANAADYLAGLSSL